MAKLLYVLVAASILLGADAAGFTTQPASTGKTNTVVSISATLDDDAKVGKCAAFTKDTTVTDAAKVNLGKDDADNAAAATLTLNAAAGARTGDLTGLTKNIAYDIYCATNDATPVLSTKLAVTTADGGFSVQPSSTGITNVKVSISTVANDATKVAKCAAFPKDATVTDAAKVNAGTDDDDNAAVATLTLNAAAGARTGDLTGLTKNIAYDIYCATNDATPVLSTKLAVTTTKVGFATQPASTGKTDVKVSISATLNDDAKVGKCAAFPAGATVTDAAKVNAGTDDGDTNAVATLDLSAAAGARTGDLTGLTKNTAYDIYCATNDATAVLSDKLEVTTLKSGFDAQPTVGTIWPTYANVTATASANVDVKCGVFAENATAPTAAELYAGTGTGGAAVNTTNGPVVAVVTLSANGAGVSATQKVTGLTKSTAYDVYCATNDGTKVLSDKVDFSTTSPTTTAAPAAATTTVSGASSEAAWSTMLTVFAIAMAAFSTL